MKIFPIPFLLALALTPFLVGAQQDSPWDSSFFGSILQIFNYINPFWWFYNILFGSDDVCSDAIYTVDSASCDCELVLNTFLIFTTGVNVRATCTVTEASLLTVDSVPVSGGTFYLEATFKVVIFLVFLLSSFDENDRLNVDYFGGCWDLSSGSSDQICFEHDAFFGAGETELAIDSCAISTEDGDCTCNICEGGELVTYSCDGVGGSTLSSPDGVCLSPFLLDNFPPILSINKFMLGISDNLSSEENQAP